MYLSGLLFWKLDDNFVFKILIGANNKRSKTKYEVEEYQGGLTINKGCGRYNIQNLNDRKFQQKPK